jgi:hypothetical protein
MCAATLLLPHMPSWDTQGQFYLYFNCSKVHPIKILTTVRNSQTKLASIDFRHHHKLFALQYVSESHDSTRDGYVTILTCICLNS